MAAYQEGKVKWFRHDGVGYIIPLDQPEESILVDQSVVRPYGEDKTRFLEKDQKVKFKTKLVLGRKVATDVQPI